MKENLIEDSYPTMKANPIILKLKKEEIYVSWRNKEEQKLVLKFCLTSLEKSQWDYGTFFSLSEDLGIPSIIIFQKILENFLESLGKNFSYYRTKLEISQKKLGIAQLSKPNPILKKHYKEDIYYNWRNQKEKQLVSKACFLFSKKVLFDSEALEKLGKQFGYETSSKIFSMVREYALNELGMSENDYKYFRYCYITIAIDCENEILLNNGYPGIYYNWKNKEQREIVLRNIYEFCEKIGWKKEEYSYFSSGFSPKLIDLLAKCYATEFLKISSTTLEKKIKNAPNPYFNLYENLWNSKREKEQFHLIETSFLRMEEIKNNVYFFLKNDPKKEEKKEFFQNIFNKYMNKQKKEVSFENYSSFLELLKNGTEKRGVDLIDYYQRFSYPFSKFMQIFRTYMSKEEIILFNKFKYKYRMDKEMTLEEILSMHIVYEVSKEGEQTTKILKEEEKTLIVSFLQEENIPLTYSTFAAAKARYFLADFESIPLKRTKNS